MNKQRQTIELKSLGKYIQHYKYEGVGEYKLRYRNKLGEWSHFFYETLALAKLDFDLKKERKLFAELIIEYKGVAIEHLVIEI